MKKLIIIFVIIFICISLGCNKRKYIDSKLTEFETLDCLDIEDFIDTINQSEIDRILNEINLNDSNKSNNSTLKEFVFCNNPFCLSVKDSLDIYLIGLLVYTGNFKNNGLLKIPKKLFYNPTIPTLNIIRKNKNFIFGSKQQFYFDTTTNGFYIVFMPYNAHLYQFGFFPSYKMSEYQLNRW
mgnify:FL=1